MGLQKLILKVIARLDSKLFRGRIEKAGWYGASEKICH